MLTLLISFFLTGSGVVSLPAFTPDSIESKIDSVETGRVTIDNIFIIGNKKTKDKIILREMDITSGGVYAKEVLPEIIEADRNKIRNLLLFTSVEIKTLYVTPNLVDVVVKVSERWYIFPVPIFNLADRNFNDWWQNQDHDFSRTSYGIKIFQNNFRGRNETLRLLLQFGYTRQFGLSYRIPYIDRSQRHGMFVGFDYAENKNIAVQTTGHDRVFLDSEDVLRLQRSFDLGYRFRNSFYTRHSAWITFNANAIADTVAIINPNYYKNGETVQRYFELSYAFQRDKRDNISYPLRGNELEAIFTKKGLGIFNDVDQFDVKLRYTQYSDLTHNFFLANYSSIYFSGPEDQPYSTLGGLGYKNDFVRGYELFVVEGQNYYLNRTTLKKRLFAFRERLNFMPVEQFRDFPLAVYLKTYFDFGYVENIDRYQENFLNTSLSNRYIYGTGAGLDIVSSYDTVLRFEYSFNREGDAGFFFHMKKEF
ncbi:MAG: POTRA domain-containing protein [Fulvivirga sp.]|nr:POTRA domain-containing protein [Fulvivirga sp.]